jgi:hypothetical protein
MYRAAAISAFGHAEAHQPEHLALAVGDLGELPGLAARMGLASELSDQAAGDARRDAAYEHLGRDGRVRRTLALQIADAVFQGVLDRR